MLSSDRRLPFHRLLFIPSSNSYLHENREVSNKIDRLAHIVLHIAKMEEERVVGREDRSEQDGMNVRLIELVVELEIPCYSRRLIEK